jgi:hypothetical protein
MRNITNRIIAAFARIASLAAPRALTADKPDSIVAIMGLATFFASSALATTGGVSQPSGDNDGRRTRDSRNRFQTEFIE